MRERKRGSGCVKSVWKVLCLRFTVKASEINLASVVEAPGKCSRLFMRLDKVE